MSKRSRKVQRQLNRFHAGEYFALVPWEVLTSVAYKAQPDFAKAVMLALAGRYRGHSNGDISLTWSEAREAGVSGEWKLRAGLKLLTIAGLIVVTRPGGNVAGGEKLPTLYAVGWLPVAQSDKYPSIAGAMAKAPNEWAAWTPPADWGETVERIKRRAQGKKRHHTREEQDAQPVRGNINGSHHTRVEQDSIRVATHGGAISRDIGRGWSDKAISLITTQPHLTDFDVARALGFKIEPGAIRQLREAVAQH